MTAAGHPFHRGFATFPDAVRSIWQRQSPVDTCELGGGRSPLFKPAEVDVLGGSYCIVDISRSELDRAPVEFTKVQADIGASSVAPELLGRFDFVFSHMLAEHIRDGRRLHANVYAMLRPGGVAFHFYPTLYYPAFVLNRLLPLSFSHKVLMSLKGDRPADSKFPAYYSQCFGPTSRMIRMLHGLGYEVVQFDSFYGSQYLQGIPVMGHLESLFGRLTERWSLKALGSFAYLVVRRPQQTTDEYSRI